MPARLREEISLVLCDKRTAVERFAGDSSVYLNLILKQVSFKSQLVKLLKEHLVANKLWSNIDENDNVIFQP